MEEKSSHKGKTFLLSLLDVSSDSFGIGTISSALKVLRRSSRIMRESLGSIDGKFGVALSALRDSSLPAFLFHRRHLPVE
ncbi:hypothetical protein Tco_0334352, partial [Tanacetum coccineum]